MAGEPEAQVLAGDLRSRGRRGGRELVVVAVGWVRACDGPSPGLEAELVDGKPCPLGHDSGVSGRCPLVEGVDAVFSRSPSCSG